MIICGNHSNQFIDPMAIMSYCNRAISFTMAASSYSKPVVGSVAKALKVIPVYRPEDAKIVGKGRVLFVDSTHIKGIETTFVNDTVKLQKGFSVLISGEMFIVDQVIDDENIKVKENEKGFNKLKIGEHRFDYIPKTDNSSLFREVHTKLKDNGCICIFPEVFIIIFNITRELLMIEQI